MIYNTETTKALNELNTLKFLKVINDLIGCRENVPLTAILNLENKNDKHLVKLQNLGYIQISSNSDKVQSVEDCKVQVTSSGKIVCGYPMSVLIDFYNSQK